jgi:hypothetical protein
MNSWLIYIHLMEALPREWRLPQLHEGRKRNVGIKPTSLQPITPVNIWNVGDNPVDANVV